MIIISVCLWIWPMNVTLGIDTTQLNLTSTSIGALMFTGTSMFNGTVLAIYMEYSYITEQPIVNCYVLLTRPKLCENVTLTSAI